MRLAGVALPWMAAGIALLAPVGCGTSAAEGEGVDGPLLACDAARLDFPSALEGLREETSVENRESIAGLITFAYGHLDEERLTREQRDDVRVMLDATDAGRRGQMASSSVDRAIRAHERFRSGLDC